MSAPHLKATNYETGLIPLAHIEMDRAFNARRRTTQVPDLMEDMLSRGQLQPVVVTALPEGRFKLVAGFRRCLAAERLGWSHIQATVHKLESTEQYEANLAENWQRKDLTLFEVSDRLQLLRDEHHLDADKLSRRLGIRRDKVRKLLQVADQLDPAVRLAIEESQLTLPLGELVSLSSYPAEQQMGQWLDLYTLKDRDMQSLKKELDKAQNLGSEPEPKKRAPILSPGDRAGLVLAALQGGNCFLGQMPSSYRLQCQAVALVLRYVRGELTTMPVVNAEPTPDFQPAPNLRRSYP